MLTPLAEPWPIKRVATFHRDYARALTQRKVNFKRFAGDTSGELRAFFTKEIPNLPTSFDISPDDGGIAARDNEGMLLGAALIGAAKFKYGITVVLRTIAVSDKERGQGLGTVLLNGLPQLIPGSSAIIGNCAEAEAKFYARAGYTVYPAGTAIPFPNAGARLWTPGETTTTHPCPIVRYL